MCLDEEHKEGCGQTPVGTYGFNKAFGIADDPGCTIPYVKVDENTYWSGDQRDGMHYNEMVDITDYPDLDMENSEHIVDYDYQYQYCLNISFNEDGTPGRGSAIFLHCFGPEKPYTGGCVAVPENIMKIIMQTVKADCVVVIDTMDNLTESAADNAEAGNVSGEDDVELSDDSSDFVLIGEAVPDAIMEIRYYSTYNFVGDRIDGYEEPLALLTRESAEALKEVSDDLKEKGYRLKIFDAYRPQMAVTNFMNWALDTSDTRMKDYFYPELDKDVLFPQGYIAEHSGHSRGSTVDLTLFDMETEKEVDMGGTFDYFGELSHPDYTDITEEQFKNRMILREAMMAHGFKPLEEEWWHFTLENEPYPDTYFTFPVNSDSVRTDYKSPSEASEASDSTLKKNAEENAPDIDVSDCDTFTQIIDKKLSDGMGYANEKIGDTEVFLVSSGTYDNLDGNVASIDAAVFEYKDDEIIELGKVCAGGTAYPLAIKDGSLYVGSNHWGIKYTIKDDALIIMEKSYVEYDADGNEKYFYESSDNSSADAESKFHDFYDGFTTETIINFQPVGGKLTAEVANEKR